MWCEEKAPAGETGGAKKLDVGKPPLFQGFINRFPRAMAAIALVSEYGQRKYGTYDGWEKVPNGKVRYTDALDRHHLKEITEGRYDDSDSGLPHAAQLAWNAMARLEMMLRDGDIDMRTGNDIKDGAPVLGTAKSVKL